MSHKRMIFAASCLFFAIACSTAAIAADTNGFYGGVGVGQSSFRIGAGNILSLVKYNDNPARLLYWETKDAHITSNTDTGYQMRLGYRINDHISLEGGYSDFGKMRFSVNQEFICPVCSFPAGGVPRRQVTGDIRVSGVDLDVVGKVPLGDRWSLLGRLGVIKARVTTVAPTESFSDFFGVPFATRLQSTQSKTSPLFGLGVEWAPTTGEAPIPVIARLEWTRYESVGTSNTGESDVDLISIGVVLKF